MNDSIPFVSFRQAALLFGKFSSHGEYSADGLNSISFQIKRDKGSRAVMSCSDGKKLDLLNNLGEFTFLDKSLIAEVSITKKNLWTAPIMLCQLDEKKYIINGVFSEKSKQENAISVLTILFNDDLILTVNNCSTTFSFPRLSFKKKEARSRPMLKDNIDHLLPLAVYYLSLIGFMDVG